MHTARTWAITGSLTAACAPTEPGSALPPTYPLKLLTPYSALPTFHPTSPAPGTTPGPPAQWGTAGFWKKTAHLCLGPRTGRHPHPQTVVPGPSPGSSSGTPSPAPSPCPSAHRPAGLRALPRPSPSPAGCCPQGETGAHTPRESDPTGSTRGPARTQPPLHPRFLLPPQSNPSQPPQLNGGETHI